jgi:hypothetical protein
MASQIIVAGTGSAVQSTILNSTKIRVTSNTSALYFAVGSNPTPGAGFANTEIIAASSTRYINMQGLGNKISFLGVNQAGAVSVTECGTVSSSAIQNGI